MTYNGTTATPWDLVYRILTHDKVRTAYLWGPPGIGKTWSAYHVHNGYTARKPVYAITLTQDTPAAELRGHYVPKGGDLVWSDGPFVKAMREGARLVLNEITHAPAEVMAICYPVLESSETARLTLPTNETVRPAEGFQVIVTDNHQPDELPEALRDRFDATMMIREPHEDAYLRIDERFREIARATVTLQGERAIGLRSWLAIQKLAKTMGDREAMTAVLGPDRARNLHDAIAIGEAKT